MVCTRKFLNKIQFILNLLGLSSTSGDTNVKASSYYMCLLLPPSAFLFAAGMTKGRVIKIGIWATVTIPPRKGSMLPPFLLLVTLMLHG